MYVVLTCVRLRQGMQRRQTNRLGLAANASPTPRRILTGVSPNRPQVSRLFGTRTS